MRVHFQSSVFRKMVMSYTLILILPTLIFLAVWLAQYDADVRKEEQRLYNSAITDIVAAVDSKFQEANTIGEYLELTTWVKKTKSSSPIINSDIDIPRQIEIRQEISVYQATIGIADTLSVVFPQRDIVVSSGFWSNQASLFYRMGVRDDSVKNWLRNQIYESGEMKFIALAPEQTISGSHGVILLKQFAGGSGTKSVLLLHITQSSMDNFINKINAEDLLSFEIIQDESAVYSSVFRDPIQGRRSIRTETPSTLFNWSYNIDYQLPGFQTGNSGLFIFALFLFPVLAIGLGSGSLLALLSYRPLQRLLMGTSGIGNRKLINTEIIEQTLHRWANERTDLESRIRQYAEDSRNNLLMSLLYGYFQREGVSDSFKQFNIEYSDSHHFQVILVGDLYTGEGNIINDMSAVLTLREDMVLPKNISAQFLELRDRVTAILLDYSEDPSDARSVISQVQTYIDENLDPKYMVFSGSVQQGLIGISKSYQEAKNEMSGITSGNSGHSVGIGYYYPLDWEIQMIHNLKIGNWTVVSSVLTELENENLARNLAAKSQHRVLNLIRETLLRIADDLSITTEQTEETFTWASLGELAESICKRTQTYADPDAGRIGIALIKYVDDNYSSSSLSLQDLSDEYKLSVSRVSRIFKNTTGVNFHKYLTITRVEKAKEAFAAGQTEIAQVWKHVGYDNETTFRRAFLSIVGVTPKKYLQNMPE